MVLPRTRTRRASTCILTTCSLVGAHDANATSHQVSRTPGAPCADSRLTREHRTRDRLPQSGHLQRPDQHGFSRLQALLTTLAEPRCIEPGRSLESLPARPQRRVRACQSSCGLSDEQCCVSPPFAKSLRRSRYVRKFHGLVRCDTRSGVLYHPGRQRTNTVTRHGSATTLQPWKRIEHRRCPARQLACPPRQHGPSSRTGEH